MNASTLADFVISMNPDKRLCVYRFEEKSFVDQRLIRFCGKNDSVDIGLCHALLNSVVGMFLIEASGFGRGLGALDLNASKLSNSFHMLDPSIITNNDRDSILNKFQPLLARNVLDLPEELRNEDRINFDMAVLSAFGIGDLRDIIYESLLSLFSIRQNVFN